MGKDKLFREGMDSSLRSRFNPCCWDTFWILWLMNPRWTFGPMWKWSQCCPLLMTGYTASTLILCMHYRCEVLQLFQWRESAGSHGNILLLGSTVWRLHPPHVIINTEGCRRLKGCVCIIPYTCIQLKNSLPVYIWK